MWSPSATRWHVGLSAGKVARVTLAGAWRQRIGSFDELVCAPGTGEAPWLAATVELTRLLQDDTVRPRSVCIVLSGRFVRWQLLAWHPELARQEEVAAHARLRFAETFGTPANDWTVLHAAQPPRKAIPACAVDASLVQQLRAICLSAGTRLQSVTPYFSGAAQNWHRELAGKTAWLGVIESDWLTLGLMHQGGWVGLHAQRVDRDWAQLLPGMMTQIALAAGMADATWPVYLVGTGDVAPASVAAAGWTRLQPAMAMPSGSPGCRMALCL